MEDNLGKNKIEATVKGREITYTRVFDAPPEIVWKAWTDKEHVANWWGPNGFTNTINKMEVKPNGEWRFIMHGPNGKDYPNKIVFIEVIEPRKLVYKHSGEEETKDVHFHVTINFDEQGGKTRLTMKSVFDSEKELQRVIKEYGALEGGKQTLTRLGEYLQNMKGGEEMQDELVITRVFDAPVEMVWKAWSVPEHFKKWWGPEGFTCPTAKIDFRVGGKHLSCMRGAGPDGKVQDFWSTGTYKEIVPLKKIVVSDSFADETGKIVPASHYGMPGDFPLEMEVILTFEKIGDKTKMTMRHVGMPKSMKADANAGWSTSFDKLEAMLKEK